MLHTHSNDQIYFERIRNKAIQRPRKLFPCDSNRNGEMKSPRTHFAILPSDIYAASKFPIAIDLGRMLEKSRKRQMWLVRFSIAELDSHFCTILCPAKHEETNRTLNGKGAWIQGTHIGVNEASSPRNLPTEKVTLHLRYAACGK